MKKCFCFLLMACLLLCGPAGAQTSALDAEPTPIAAEQPTPVATEQPGTDNAEKAEATEAPAETIHLLWDIPFGLSIDETIEQLRNITGFTLEARTVGDGAPRFAYIRFQPADYALISGFLADSIWADFYESQIIVDADGNKTLSYPPSASESLNRIRIMWDVDSDASPEYAANMYAGLLYDLEKKYGKATDSAFWLEGDRYALIEKKNGYVDTTNILKAIENKEEAFLVAFSIGNVSLVLHCVAYSSSYLSAEIGLLVNDHIISSREALQQLVLGRVISTEGIAQPYDDIADLSAIKGITF